MPSARALATASPIARLALTCPIPPSPSTTARGPRSTTTRTFGRGLIDPSRIPLMYVATRTTPCDETPRTSASPSDSATPSAAPGGSPLPVKMPATVAFRRSGATATVGGMVPPMGGDGDGYPHPSPLPSQGEGTRRLLAVHGGTPPSQTA